MFREINDVAGKCSKVRTGSKSNKRLGRYVTPKAGQRQPHGRNDERFSALAIAANSAMRAP